MKLYYIFDTYCGWCYGFESVLRPFVKAHPELEVEVISGGLFGEGKPLSAYSYMPLVNQKITGVYEDAIPSKELPKSIVVSGVTYEVEGVDAFNDLSSSGSVAIGDTVTLLLGRDGEKVAGVATLNDMSGTITGYVTGSGKKSFKNSDGTTYQSYYVDVVAVDGTAYTYPTSTDKSNSVNKVCKITIKDGKAQVGSSISATSVSGAVSYSDLLIGNNRVSSDVTILDVAKNVYSDVPLYTKTYMQRLDGMTLKDGQVLYTQKNSNGEISEMILQNVTGDMYSYGIITAVTKQGTSVVGATIESSGNGYAISGMSNLSVGLPVKFIKNGMSADYAQSLDKISGGVDTLTTGYAEIGGKKYLLSPTVEVFQKEKLSTKYMRISLTDAINGDYSYACYTDDAETGRVRVIIVN